MYFLKYRSFNIYFVLLIIAHFAAMGFFQQYEVVTKPLLMASLMGLYISSEIKQNNIFILGILFALMGDIFLNFDSDDFFKIGLGSFLLMQLCYIYVFSIDKTNVNKPFLIKTFGVVLLLILMISLLWNNLGELKIPVVIYMLVIGAMSIMAFLRNSKIAGYSGVVIGAILFLLSDAFLAYGKFINMVTGLNYIVMATYIAAQYLIVTGILEKTYIKTPSPKKTI